MTGPRAATVTYSANAFRRAGFVGGGKLLWLADASPTDLALDAFRDAVAAANEQLVDLEAEELYAQLNAPTPTPLGPMALVRDCEPIEAMRRMLDLVARGLEARGVSGVLKPARSVANPPYDMQVFPTVVAQLLLPVDESLVLESYTRHARHPTREGWYADPAATRRVVTAVLDWLLSINGPVYARVGAQFAVEPEAVRDFVLATLPHDHRVRVRRNAEGGPMRAACFSEYGAITVQSSDPARPPTERAAELESLLAAVASDLSTAFIRDSITSAHDRQTTLEWPPKAPIAPVIRRDYWASAHLEAEYVYDAFPAQLLTADQLARTTDLPARGWQVIDVAPGRHLVRHPDPDRWFTADTAARDNQPPTSAVPDDVLHQARADFGAAIMTAATLEENPPPLAPDEQATALGVLGLTPRRR